MWGRNARYPEYCAMSIQNVCGDMIHKIQYQPYSNDSPFVSIIRAFSRKLLIRIYMKHRFIHTDTHTPTKKCPHKCNLSQMQSCHFATSAVCVCVCVSLISRSVILCITRTPRLCTDCMPFDFLMVEKREIMVCISCAYCRENWIKIVILIWKGYTAEFKNQTISIFLTSNTKHEVCGFFKNIKHRFLTIFIGHAVNTYQMRTKKSVHPFKWEAVRFVGSV